MIRPRLATMVLGTLAVAGVIRTIDSIAGYDPERPGDSAFLAAANAAVGAEDDMDRPMQSTPANANACTAEPRPICETPEMMLQALNEERELIDSQKERLAQREAEIDLAEEKLLIEQERLTALKGELDDRLERIRKAQTDDVDRLVALYSAMKPKEAAAIMDDMDIEVSVMVLATMAERDAAPILARMNMTRARAISRIILERSKLPGDQRLDDLKL
jgi:flagellar motility protein MotE (MotC chaperone)